MNISIKRAQNDACIGSVEREKYGTQFKKTFRFLSMATLLVVGAIMTGCSSDDNIDNPQQPANNDNVVTLTATVSLDGGAATRAINGTTGAKTFETGKQIAVLYKNTSNETVKAVSFDFTPTGDNTKATFTVTLTNPANNSDIRYIYPATMAKAVATTATITDDDATIDYSGLLGSQDGTLTKLANYDLAVKDATLSGTDQPATVTLTNPLAICKFTLTDGTNPITSSVNSLTVSDGTNTYHVTPSAQSTIYVAMKPVASQKIAFTAATGSKTYFKTTASAQTLAASKLYTNITVSMEELAVGKVIGFDGNIYVDAAAAGAGNAAAKIVYLGSDNGEVAPYNHGLALALTDANDGNTCQWSTTSTKIHSYNTTSSNFTTSEGGLQYNDATHNCDTYPAFKAAIANNGTAAPTGCSEWFLASGYQWTKMFAGDAGGLKTLAGLESSSYWSSSEGSADRAWYFRSGDGRWSRDRKSQGVLVRSCLAF